MADEPDAGFVERRLDRPIRSREWAVWSRLTCTAVAPQSIASRGICTRGLPER